MSFVNHFVFSRRSFRHSTNLCPLASLGDEKKQKKLLKNISERIAPARSLSYQRLPDASPQHHPTHSLKVHRNMKPSHWGASARERARYSRRREREKKRLIAWEHSEGKVDHRAEEGRLEGREAGKKWICGVKDQSPPIPPPHHAWEAEDERKEKQL